MSYIYICICLFAYIHLIIAEPSLKLIATHKANHATYGSFASVSPNGNLVYATYFGDANFQLPGEGIPQEANILTLVGNTLQVSKTLFFDSVYTEVVGGGASRSFKLFALVDFDPIALNLRLRILDINFNIISSRVFFSEFPSDISFINRITFTDDDKYLSIGLSPVFILGDFLHILDVATLTDQVIQGFLSNNMLDGHFFSACQPQSDFLALGVLGINFTTNVVNANVSFYRFDKNPPNLVFITSTPIPQTPLSVSVTPYTVPRIKCDLVRLIITTAQADLPDIPNMRQQDSQAPTYLPGDENEVRIISFNGHSVFPVAFSDVKGDSLSASLNPYDNGNTFAVAVSPEQTEYAFTTNTSFFDDADSTAAEIIHLQKIVSGLRVKDIDHTFPIGNQLHNVNFNNLGTFLTTGTCKGFQNYNISDGPLFGGSWNNIGLWKVYN